LLSAIWVKLNELPVGNCSTWNHRLSTFTIAEIRETSAFFIESSLALVPNGAKVFWLMGRNR
jgi:hypothetical protein